MERLPADLNTVLAGKPKTRALWQSLTSIARRDFISWIESAKQVETRKRRVESVPSRLTSGKRRPCCYAVIPMNLYKALSSLPKAKAQWSTLTPDEKRDFATWIDSATGSDMRTQKIEKVCVMLLKGKRHP